MSYSHTDILRIYAGSNGDATKALYAKLQDLGPVGIIALNLFRACKASERAKVYRGRGYKDAAYQKKDWSLGLLCEALEVHAIDAGIAAWGWGLDEKTVGYIHVLYVETPAGQVSFHNAHRLKGVDFPGQWDGQRGTSSARIVRWTATLLEQRQAA